jgi:PAS domain-containing protein
MQGKTKEQLLNEISEVQKLLDEKTELRGKMIKNLQTLIADNGLFSQIIDSFPYPIAIFTPDYELAVVNDAFVTAVKVRPERILQYKIEDNQLISAIIQVFKGDSFFLEELKSPFSMFQGIKLKKGIETNIFKKAIVFPVLADDNNITHGVIVFLP